MLPVPGLSFLFISFLIHPARPITDFDSKKWDTRKRDFAKKKKKKKRSRSFRGYCGRIKRIEIIIRSAIYIYQKIKKKKRFYLNYENISLEKEGSF